MASKNAETMMKSISDFSSKLNLKGTLANDLVTDTLLYNSLKLSVFEIQHTAETAKALIKNLNEASKNTKSTVGVLLYDETAGSDFKETISNLEKSSKKLDENLEALQKTIFFRRYFKKKNKEKSK